MFTGIVACTGRITRVAPRTGGVRMTVVPLVVSLLIAGVTSNAGSRFLGPLGARSVVVFVCMLAAGGTLSALVSPVVLSRMTLAPAVAESLRSTAATGADSRNEPFTSSATRDHG